MHYALKDGLVQPSNIQDVYGGNQATIQTYTKSPNETVKRTGEFRSRNNSSNFPFATYDGVQVKDDRGVGGAAASGLQFNDAINHQHSGRQLLSKNNAKKVREKENHSKLNHSSLEQLPGIEHEIYNGSKNNRYVKPL